MNKENEKKVNENNNLEINNRVMIDILLKISCITKVSGMLLDFVQLEKEYYSSNQLLTLDEQNNIIDLLDKLYITLNDCTSKNRAIVLDVFNKRRGINE